MCWVTKVLVFRAQKCRVAHVADPQLSIFYRVLLRQRTKNVLHAVEGKDRTNTLHTARRQRDALVTMVHASPARRLPTYDVTDVTDTTF